MRNLTDGVSVPRRAEYHRGPTPSKPRRRPTNASPIRAAGAERLTGREASAPRPIGRAPKRLLDIALAAIVLAMAAPLMIFIVLAIRLTTGGPAIFSHVRVGFRGQPFQCYKFRTMVADADAVLARHLAACPEAAREWAENRKLRSDPRVTPLGRVLRMSSMDELPQLFNVLRGEMSCVGPRPIMADELSRYGAAAEDYLSARPGLTGLWQVSGRDVVGYAKRVQLDSFYVRNWSMASDIAILMRTIFVLIRFDQAS